MESVDLTNVPIVDNHCHGVTTDQAFGDVEAWKRTFSCPAWRFVANWRWWFGRTPTFSVRSIRQDPWRQRSHPVCPGQAISSACARRPNSSA